MTLKKDDFFLPVDYLPAVKIKLFRCHDGIGWGLWMVKELFDSRNFNGIFRKKSMKKVQANIRFLESCRNWKHMTMQYLELSEYWEKRNWLRYSITNSRGILSAEKFKPKGIFYFGLIFRAYIRLKEHTIEKEEVYGEQRREAKDNSKKFLW